MAADPLLFYPAAPNRPSSDPVPDDPRKVKFLCSFGGQIIPRPSDGALRYAGGQTRIISVRRDAPLPEIMNKMAEVFGGHAALRYQLPDVDLDALVSVSSPEDLENMMEEYDKIAEAAPDGSAKLRVFLFSPSDLAPDPASLLDLEDYSQRYVEAVNRISSDGSLRRKDSLASASSAHNSGGGINGGTSPEILSPTAAAANDSSRLFFVGAPSPPAGFPDPPVLPANPPIVASNATTSRVELSPYTSQPYADPNQFQYMNSQPMGTPPGSLPISPLAIPQYQYAPVASHVGTEKSVPAIVDSYGGRTTQLHGDPNSRAGNHLVSQLLPVPPTYLQPQNVELYGVRQAVPPPMQGQGYRLEDCYMCHKALPHAHSDTQVQEHGSATSEASTTFHSLRAEDATRLGTPSRVIAPSMTENKVAVGPFVSYGFAPIPEVRHDNEKLAVPNVVSDHSSALRPPAVMGLPSDTQASSGMFVNVPQYRREDSLQKQQQQSLVQPQPMVKQDGIVELYRNGVYPVKNVNLQATEALNLGHVPEFPPNHPGPLEGMMETLRVSPFDNSVYNEERKPTVTPNLVISKELKPEKVPLVEINHPVRPQVGGKTSFMGSGFRNPGIMQEGSYARPGDQLLASSLGLTQSQNLQPTVSSQVLTQETFFFNHETGREPMVPSKVLHAMPAYSCSINPVQTNNTNTVSDGDRKDETSRYSKDMLGDFAAPTNIKFPFPFPNSIHPTQQVELFDEPVLPDSLFPSQDPIKISGGTNFLPPRPIRVASRESIIAKDLSTENLSIANQGPDIALLLDDNVFYQPPNSLIKDSCRDPVARGTRGLEEEQINKELQAVAEGAATAVLQSSVPSMPVFVARETKGSTSQFNIEGVIDDITSSNNATFLGDHRVEDTKSKLAENLNSGFLIGDEIGRLQIIKNSDLEELKELGSGTFGTVYHGKWRGSDVAIKRINNRCFAGKPSEQERTRADFWNEASKLSDLHHPNVVAFYGVVVDGPGGSVATVTEYMVNGSLRQALQKNDKTFDRSKRLLIAMDVAFGMEYLHSKNIVHFDLKSDNLLVNLRDPQRPICKVGDLGLSKVKCQTLISGGVRGTLPWMAPELLNGSSSLVSEKVDVFSFGIVMWEILTGKEPYADMHYGAIIGGIVSNTLRPPVPETCELDWRSLMERCWSSEPSERPSFTEIASGLRAMAASPSSKGR